MGPRRDFVKATAAGHGRRRRPRLPGGSRRARAAVRPRAPEIPVRPPHQARPGVGHQQHPATRTGPGGSAIERAPSGASCPARTCSTPWWPAWNIPELDPEEGGIGYGGTPNAYGVVELDSCCMHGPAEVGRRRGRHHRRAHALPGGQGRGRAHRPPPPGGAGRAGVRPRHRHDHRGRPQHAPLPRPLARVAQAHRPHPLAGPEGAPGGDRLGPHRDRPGPHPPRRVREMAERLFDGFARASLAAGLSHGGRRARSGVVVLGHGDEPGGGESLRGHLRRHHHVGDGIQDPGRAPATPRRSSEPERYVDNGEGAAGSTGRGEANLYNLTCFLIVENMRRGMAPKDAGLEALKRIQSNTIEPRLLNSRGLPNFDIRFFVLNKKGEYAGLAMYGQGESTFAVCDENGAREEPLVGLLEGSPRG
ncbi:MAG: isoaspartyl peptidase/L-asparaginase [Chromatiales bacterium]|nr:isoaspartyl peptidase/L-asparaginase [Chromatiales bacterium]